MHPIEILSRCAAFSLLLLIAIVLIKDHHGQPSGTLGAILAFSGAWDGMLPFSVEWGWNVLIYPVQLAMSVTLVSFWLLSRSLFEESFEWKWRYLLVFATLVGLSCFGQYITYGVWFGFDHLMLRSKVAYHGLGLVPAMLMLVILVSSALYAALKEWRVDLVESRRRARAVFVLVMGSLILVVTTAEFFAMSTPRSRLTDSVVAVFVFLLALGFASWFLGFRWGKLAQSAAPVFPSETAEHVAAAVDGHGTALIDELQRLMAEKQLFCEEGLTIGRLAKRVGIKEYMLRRLINGHLGYRNYNQFLNQYRIEEAARRLIAPETRHLPVLTIALDVGYRSLSVFNRAFKDMHGLTPTEYRNRRQTGEA